jgi:hypothetical protein
MWKFYRAVVRSAIREFWTATDEVLIGIAVLSFFAILVNRKYGKHIVTATSPHDDHPFETMIPARAK